MRFSASGGRFRASEIVSRAEALHGRGLQVLGLAWLQFLTVMLEAHAKISVTGKLSRCLKW